MPAPSPPLRAVTASVLCFRIAYGLGLVVAPAKLAGNRWLGPGAREAAAEVPLRGMGAREVAVHGLALGALLSGRPVRPWLAASIAGDLADVGAAALARERLPENSAVATAAVAGGSALLTAAILLLLDD